MGDLLVKEGRVWNIGFAAHVCRQDRRARELLADIHNDWFVERFDALDLVEARELLEDLS